MSTNSQSDPIATLAYEYWEAEGRPHGKDVEHWLKAEQALANPTPSKNEAHILRPIKVTPRARA